MALCPSPHTCVYSVRSKSRSIIALSYRLGLDDHMRNCLYSTISNFVVCLEINLLRTMHLFLVVVCLVAANAVPMKKSSDYDYVMHLVEHAYHSVDNSKPIGPYDGSSYLGKRDERSSDYDSVMDLVEHAYHSVDHSQPIGPGYYNGHTLGKKDLSALLESLKDSIANVGSALHQTFGGIPQHGAELLSSVVQTGLQPVAGLLNNVLHGLQQSNMVDVQKRGAKEFFANIGDQLSTTFTSLGHAFQTTFQGLAQTAAQHGADLLTQALQGGAQVVASGANTFANNLQQPQVSAQKRNVHDVLSNLGQQLSATFTNLGNVLQNTFHGLAETATQQGATLLSQALQGTNMQAATERRNAADLLTELQHQLTHLGDLLNPFHHSDAQPLPGSGITAEQRNARNLLTDLQNQLSHIGDLLNPFHHSDAQPLPGSGITAEQRNARNLLTDLQNQLSHIGDLLNPFHHSDAQPLPGSGITAEQRNARNLLTDLQNQLSHIGDLLNPFHHSDAQPL
ncbi:uncharacterized protein LOC110458036 isoform X3 [Mizuhopecten yessoensis]|uniref:uncharacterized protein LOC110458036 isoform X3 n=1 Tax=Mizuhopecten yessoensis TaxID=6573 RepID=UPI000B45EA81|nr:uncharacterized protein LOC110458036 isoform X3 [Mizuhopecten yessoensis]